MRISEILRTKGGAVVTIAPADTVSEVVGTLAQYGVGALVVSNDGRGINGIVSERDVVRALAENGLTTLELAAADIMTLEVVTATPDMSIDDVMARMTEGRFRHMPVTEDGRLVGIISIGDVVNARLAALELETEQLTNYISGR